MEYWKRLNELFGLEVIGTMETGICRRKPPMFLRGVVSVRVRHPSQESKFDIFFIFTDLRLTKLPQQSNKMEKSTMKLLYRAPSRQ